MTKAEIGRIVREHWKKQEAPRTVRTVLPAERAAEKLAGDWLRATGFDLKAAEAIQRQHRAEWEKGLPKLQADAAKRAARRIKAADAEFNARVGTSQPASAFPSTAVILDRPNAIIASDPGFVEESHIERLKSFARIRVDRTAGTVDTLSFVFLFQNQFSTALRCDAQSVLRAHGSLTVRQHGHVLGLGGSASVRVMAKMAAVTFPSASSSQELANMFFAFTRPPIWWVDHTEGPTAFSGIAPLNATGIFVRPSETAIILVSLEVDSDFDGHMIADMASGSFSVQCHHMILQLTQPFPDLVHLPDVHFS